MGKYRLKTTVIEAIQWTGENTAEILKFIGRAILSTHRVKEGEGFFIFRNPLGEHITVNKGEYLIKGSGVLLRTEKDYRFEQDYEEVT